MDKQSAMLAVQIAKAFVDTGTFVIDKPHTAEAHIRGLATLLEKALAEIPDGSGSEPAMTLKVSKDSIFGKRYDILRPNRSLGAGLYPLYTHPAPTAQDSRPQSPDRDTWTAHQSLEHELVVSLEATIETYGSPHKALQALLVAEGRISQDSKVPEKRPELNPVEAHKRGEVVYPSEQYYNEGWNDCVDAMLSAAPSLPEKPQEDV